MRKTKWFVLRVFIKNNIDMHQCITQNKSVRFAGVYLRGIFSCNYNDCRQNKYFNYCKQLQTRGYPPRVRVRVYPGSKNGYPPRYPYPHHWVWVFAGTGTGTAKSTRGLPVMFTRYTYGDLPLLFFSIGDKFCHLLLSFSLIQCPSIPGLLLRAAHHVPLYFLVPPFPTVFPYLLSSSS